MLKLFILLHATTGLNDEVRTLRQERPLLQHPLLVVRQFFFVTIYFNYVPCPRDYFPYVTLIFTF